MNTKQMTVLLIEIVGAFFLMQALNIQLPIHITLNSSVANSPSELAVVGEGKVDAVPDTANIQVGITVDNASTVEIAQQKISTVHTALVASLQKLGVQEADIKTSNYSITPNYSYDISPTSLRPNTQSKITGYNGNATLSIKTKKTDIAGQIIDEATKVGANQVGNINFTVDQPDVYREAAREKAIANAKDQAAKLAKSLGIRLGKVTNMVESNTGEIQPYYAMKTMDSLPAAGGGAPALETGTQTVTSTVTLYFEKQ